MTTAGALVICRFIALLVVAVISVQGTRAIDRGDYKDAGRWGFRGILWLGVMGMSF